MCHKFERLYNKSKHDYELFMSIKRLEVRESLKRKGHDCTQQIIEDAVIKFYEADYCKKKQMVERRKTDTNCQFLKMAVPAERPDNGNDRLLPVEHRSRFLHHQEQRIHSENSGGKMNLPAFMKANLDIYLRNYMRQKASECKICNGTLIVEDEKYVTNCPACDRNFSKRVFVYANIGTEYLDIEMADTKSVFSADCYDGLSELHSQIVNVVGKTNLFIHRHDDNHSYGTTTMGILLVKELIRKGYPAFVIPASSLVDYFFGFGETKLSAQKQEMLDFVQSIPVLFINDITMEFKKGAGKDYLYTTLLSFLGKRKLNGKLTIMSTELTLKEFEGEYPGTIINHLRMHFIAMSAKCHIGKNKQTAAEKFKSIFGNTMPSMSKYLSKEDAPPPNIEDLVDKKDIPNKKKFIGSSYRK
jgi:DNA replication protein DnaC